MLHEAADLSYQYRLTGAAPLPTPYNQLLALPDQYNYPVLLLQKTYIPIENVHANPRTF